MRFFAVLVGIALLSSIGFSATIHVPDNYPTIQDAINASANGDTVIVRPGTFTENVDFVGKAITLTSELGPAVTTIDGGGNGPTVVFRSGEGATSILEGFEITNGTGHQVAGFDLGGGILCGPAPSSPTIRGNLIRGNDCFRGSGIGLYDASSPLIAGNTITNNTGSFGAGICCYEMTARIVDNVIADNRAGTYGGAICCWDRANPTISGNEILRNRSDVAGGAIYCHEAKLILRDNNFHGNSSYRGGGIYASGGSGIVSDNAFTGNSSEYREHGGAIYCASLLIITRNVFFDNKASTGEGGGIYCRYHDPFIVGNTIVGNEAARGGGIGCDDSLPTLIGNTIADNRAGEYGGGIFGNSASRPTVTNTILWGNTATTGPVLYGCGSAVTYSDVEGGWYGAGNIDADPLFIDAPNGDYHLTWNSPCLNAGDTSAVKTLHDVEGDPRITAGAVEIGSDEYYPHLYHLGDVTPAAGISIRVVGYPGAQVWLARGAGVLDPPLSTRFGALYLSRPFVKSWTLGTVPADGVLRVPTALPGHWVTGEQYCYQALVGPATPFGTMLTNPVVATVK